MSAKNIKKEFNTDQLYRKIMPSYGGQTSAPSSKEKPAEAPQGPLNYMEVLVGMKQEKAMKMLKCCCCLQCQRDVAAIALNALPPVYYHVALEEEPLLVDRLAREYDVQVMSVLIKAVQKVKTHPRHTKTGGEDRRL